MASDEQTRPEEQAEGVSLPVEVESLPIPALKGEITPTGLLLPEDMTYEEWASQLQVVWFLYEWSPWALADMLEYGEAHFAEGDKYLQAMQITGKARQTLYNMTLLARKFPNRDGLRSEKLPQGHHRVIQAMDEDDRRYYLKFGENRYEEKNGHYGWRDFQSDVQAEERVRSGAKTEKAPQPVKCGECFGSGKCPRCHGSGQEHQT